MIEYDEIALDRVKKLYITDVENRIENAINNDVPTEIYTDALANLLIKKLVLKNCGKKYFLARMASGYDYHCDYLNEKLKDDK